MKLNGYIKNLLKLYGAPLVVLYHFNQRQVFKMRSNILYTILVVVLGASSFSVAKGNASELSTFHSGAPPFGLALNPSGSRIFLTNSYRGQIVRCNVNTKSGVFSDCHGTWDIGLKAPDYIFLNASGNRAYVIDSGYRRINQCDIDPATGVIFKCFSVGAKGLDMPNGIALDKSGSRAFVTDHAHGTVSKCDVDLTGIFSKCYSTGKDVFTGITSVVLNSSGNRAFMTHEKDNGISRCDVNSNGDFSGCSNTGGTGFIKPRTIVLNGSGNRAYVANGNGAISQCSVDTTTGIFSKCSSNIKFEAFIPSAMALNRSGNLAFISGFSTFLFGSNEINRCSVNVTTGVISNCFNVFYNVDVVSEDSDNVGLPDNFEHKISIDKGDNQLKTAYVMNISVLVNDFHVVVPTLKNDKTIQQLSTNCPLTPKFFDYDNSCKVFYKISSGSQKYFSKKILFKSGKVVFAQLEIARDPVLFVSTNNKEVRLNNITDFSLQKSPKSVSVDVMKRQGVNITSAKFSLSSSLSDANISLSGDCMNKKSPLLTAGICHLKYTIPAASTPVSGDMILTTNLGITHLPFSIKSQGFYLSVSKYKSEETANMPVSSFTFIKGHSYIIHISDISKSPFQLDLMALGILRSYLDDKSSTCNLYTNNNNNKSCDLHFHIPVSVPRSKYVRGIIIISKHVYYHYPVIIPDTPDFTVTLTNKGGYVLLSKYPNYQNIDGSFNFKPGKRLMIDQSDKVLLLKGSQILLQAAGGIGRSECITIDHPNGHIRCTRAETNMVCYWIDGKGKSKWVRTVKDKHGNLKCPGWINKSGKK